MGMGIATGKGMGMGTAMGDSVGIDRHRHGHGDRYGLGKAGKNLSRAAMQGIRVLGGRMAGGPFLCPPPPSRAPRRMGAKAG